MAQQAFKHIVKKVVSASAVVAVSGDDHKDEMDEIAHLVFGAGTVTPKYDSSGTLVSATTPPPGQPLQVHSNPRTNAAIIDLGRRMASNPSIQKGVIETINQSGWIMYGAGSMCLPLEDWDEPGVAEHEEMEPGAVPLSDDEDWQEDFDDGTDLKAEEPLARSYPHMSITGGAPVRSNSVPLLSAHKITTDDVESPDFSPTISPTPSCTSSDASSSIETLPPSSSSPPLTDSMREHRRQRAERARKQPGIFQSFAGWIQSFFMPIPASTSVSTSMSHTTPSTATASEEKHGVVHDEEGHVVIDEKQVVSTTSTDSSSSTSTSTSSSTSTSTSKSCWYNNHIVAAALGVATVIILLFATRRVSQCMFSKLVAYLRR